MTPPRSSNTSPRRAEGVTSADSSTVAARTVSAVVASYGAIEPSTPYYEVKHPRYLSDWADNVVHVNVAHFSAPPNKREVDIEQIHLSTKGGIGLYRDVVLPLKNFPHLIEAIKRGINRVLTIHDRGDTNVELTAFLSTCQKLLAYMLRNGIYTLSSFSRNDAHELIKNIALRGWQQVLDYETALRTFLLETTNDPRKAIALLGRSINTKIARIDDKSLGSAIGLPIRSCELPVWFIEGIVKIADTQQVVHPRASSEKARTTRNQTQRAMEALNLLANLPQSIDSISPAPFSDIDTILKTYYPTKGGRTANLSIEVAVELLDESLRWLYDYRPVIIELSQVARQHIESLPFTTIKGDYQRRIINREISEKIETTFSDLKRRYDLPINLPTCSKNGRRPLNCLIDKLMTACLTIIGINHARRREEMIGEGKPYGLYFGCVTETHSPIDDKCFDVWVEKSLQDYAQFWCNALVSDAVACLEELAQIFRPLHTPPKQRNENLEERRQDKLFVQRRFTVEFSTKVEQYSFDNHSTGFFKDLKTQYSLLSGSHHFRRLFAILYIWRYDHPVLLALKEHMKHLDLRSTALYAKDPNNRQIAERIEVAYKQSLELILSALEEARTEYFDQKLIQMLRGEEIGGFFPRLVLKLVKRMSSNAKFLVLTIEEKARILSEHYRRKGYSPNEKAHCACMAGNFEKAIRSGNCSVDGKLDTSRASVKMCDGCPNQLDTPNYMSSYEDELKRLETNALNPRLPPSVRLESTRTANLLRDILDFHRKVARQNARWFQELADSWQPIIFQGSTP